MKLINARNCSCETVEIKGLLTAIIFDKMHYEDGTSKDVVEFRDSFGCNFLLEQSEIEEFIENFQTFMKTYGGEHEFNEKSRGK